MFKKTKKIVPVKSIEVQKCINDIDYDQLLILSDSDRLKILEDLKNKLIKYFSTSINLSDFKFFYITSGITDGLNYLNNQYLNCDINVGVGDYEYFNYLKRETTTTDEILYISNPSAIDGNFVQEWDSLLENKRIILDCAYLGTTSTKEIKINKNVETVLLSLSKTFGLYENRIGFIFTNRPLPLLHGIIYDNCYFNISSCILTMNLLDKFPLGHIHNLYKDQQNIICGQYNLQPSDVCFIASSTDDKYSFYKRKNTNRLCLTEKIQLL
jgi:hypothetical protein